MNSTIAKLADEFEKMEKTIASQKKMIETLMPTGYVDTDTVKLHLNSVYGVMFGGRPSPKRCKLEDCSWDEINMYSSFGLADKMFEVGDTKKFRLADGSYLTARIIGFNHDYAEDGSLSHITFETVETLDGDISMNEKSTNEGGWDASYLRAKLNGNFFEKQLPADLKAVIKPVVKITAKSGKNEMLVPSVDKLFVLSEQEVFGRKIYSCGGEGKWYEWYKRENTPYGKCKQNGERDWRWERSPRSGGTDYFCTVRDSGTAAVTAPATPMACPSASAFDLVSRKSRPVRGGERSENMNVNRKVGTGFERDLCLSLSGCGFWAHNLAQNSQGQPFDVIAARNGVSYPIDCKDCSKNIFKMERIEENQFSAMSLWEEMGNGEGWFALRMMNGAVYFLSFTVIRNLFLMKTVLSASEIKQFGITLGEWVSQCK